MGIQCKCRKGYVSQHDGKCGHCRTRADAEKLYRYLRELDRLYELTSPSTDNSDRRVADILARRIKARFYPGVHVFQED